MSSLYQKLLTADVVCRDCGSKYGKYSVGCSSTWEGTCDVCGETKGVTEVRDWGYLTKGMNELRPELKQRIKEQSKQVAEYMKSQESTLTEEEVASYEKGEITLKLTEEEVGFLNECLDTLQEFHSTLQPEEEGWRVSGDIALFENVEKKIVDLYDDYCVKYQLSPALKAYYEKYGEYGTGEYAMRWEGFRDAFVALKTEGAK